MTIGGWIVFAVIAGCLILGAVCGAILCENMVARISVPVICVVATIGTLAGMLWYFGNTASGQRAMVDQQSDLGNGLNRVIRVYTANGEGTTAGTHEFTWDGKDSDGNLLEDGAYQIIVSPKVASGETAATVTTTVFGKVTGVANDDNGVYIGLGNAVTAGLGDIVTMRDDNYFNDKNTGGGNSSDEEKPSDETAQA